MTATPDKPVIWTCDIDDQGRESLGSGEHRLAITIHAFQPAEVGNSSFVVNLLTDGGKKRTELDRFAIFPQAPLDTSSGTQPHKFLVSLQKATSMLERRRLVIEIGFQSPAEEIRGAAAELQVEIQDVRPPAPEKKE